MKKIILAAILASPLCCLSQSLGFNASLGYAIIKTENYKKLSLTNNFVFYYETKAKNNFSLVMGIGGRSVKNNDQDVDQNKFYNNKLLVHLPVSVRKKYYLTSRTHSFVEFGGYVNYHLLDKKEFEQEQHANITSRNLGFSTGVLFNTGIQTKLTPITFLSICLAGQQDIAAFYKNDKDAFTCRSTSLLIGLTRSL